MDETSRLRSKLRQEAIEWRKAISPGERIAKSTAICQQVLELPVFMQAKHILLYCHFRTEVMTDALLNACFDAKKQVCLPCTLAGGKKMQPRRVEDASKPLQPGYMGIPEPGMQQPLCDSKLLDLIIVPGLVFDRRGQRLGYGAGCYDRFLCLHAPQALRLGVCFSEQLIDILPAQPHDAALDYLVTEQSVLCWPGRKR